MNITTAPQRVFVGDYKFSSDTGTADNVKYTEEISSFTLMIGFADSTFLIPVKVEVSNRWNNNEKNPGYTDKMKALFEEVKKLKPGNFTVTIVGNEITRVTILPIFKDAKDGGVGELVAPERELSPTVFFDESLHGH